MKKLAILTTAIVMVLSLSPFIRAATYGGGSGTEVDPYQIWTPQQMNTIGANSGDWGKCFKLMTNINMSGITGTQYNIIGYRNSSTDYLYFTGIFNGNNKVIQNFNYLVLTNKTAVGLFGAVGNAQIMDLTMTNVNVDVSLGTSIGGLVGYQDAGSSITNCHVAGSIKGRLVIGGLAGFSSGTVNQCSSSVTITTNANNEAVGGLIGYARGTMNACSSAGVITGGYDSRKFGGLIGLSFNATVNDSFSTVDVIAGEKAIDIGGLAGYLTNGSFTDCYASGAVSAGITSKDVGGLVGLFQGTAVLECCSSTGDVTSGANSSYVGGLIGDYFAGDIKSSFSTGNVASDSVTGLGGLIGMHGMGTVWHCYCTGNVTGDNQCTYVGGFAGGSSGAIVCSYSTGTVSTNPAGDFIGAFCGYSYDVVNSFWNSQTAGIAYSGGGRPRTTAQMRQASNYINWNTAAAANWVIDEGVDYPHLAWEGAPGTTLPATPITIYLEGQGTTSDPFLIYDASDLNVLGFFYDQWDKNYRLTSDIDMSAIGGGEFNMIGSESIPFSGSFEGDGHWIDHFTYTAGSENTVGLFKVLSGKVSNVGLDDVVISVDSGGSIGGLIGSATSSSTVSNCCLKGEIHLGDACDSVGGMIGSSGGSVSNCDSNITITMGQKAQYVGGLIGSVYGDEAVTQCGSIASISSGNESDYIGGLIGNGSIPLVQCFAVGTITTGNNCLSIGGIVGDFNDSINDITNCYSKVDLTCGSSCQNIGGLVGYLSSGADIYYCYSMGNVTCGQLSTQVGGLVGYVRSGNGSYAYDSFWDKQTSGQAASAAGTGRDTAQMLMKSSYPWDFLNTWRICNGMNYPRLQWEPLPAGDFICPDGIGMEDLALFVEYWLGVWHEKADIVDDSIVNMTDLSVISQKWMLTECGDCNGADITGDGNVDIQDVIFIAEQWLFVEDSSCQQADIDNSGTVDLADLSMLAANWMLGQ